MHARDIKIILSSLFRPHGIRTTAYLDMVHVFSNHDFCSRWVVQSHNSVLHRPKRKAIYLMAIEIVLCGTIPSLVNSFHMKAKSPRSVDFRTQSSPTGVSSIKFKISRLNNLGKF